MFSEAAQRVPRYLPVPGCPGFNVADLLWHVAVVHNFWGAVVAGHLSAPDEVMQPERLPDPELVHFYDRTFERLVSTLSGADPDANVWTPTPQNDVRFVARRVTHETAVHRCDLDIAWHGEPRAVNGLLAEDGIDEWLTVLLQSRPRSRIDFLVEETGRSWSLGDGPTPQAVLHDSASAILLGVWRRIPIDRLRIERNQAIAVEFIEEATLLS
jgi:uncharacterized protein (TIGR03083 family)